MRLALGAGQGSGVFATRALLKGFEFEFDGILVPRNMLKATPYSVEVAVQELRFSYIKGRNWEAFDFSCLTFLLLAAKAVKQTNVEFICAM